LPTGLLDVVNYLIGRVEQDIVVKPVIDPCLQARPDKALVDALTP